MYLDFFGFDCEPFNITPDSKFLFASLRHREAMASLLYGIEQRKGFIALTGEVGSGKTTICRALLKELDRERIRLALVLNPQLNDLELLQAINAEFGLPHASTSKRELLEVLNKFLLDEYARGHNCVLVIDESQRLSFEALEQVRLISNLELESTKLIQIALVGQPELDEMLHRPELEQLNQRIMVRYHISPLDLEETRQYIEHRLHVASPNTPAKFNARAVRAIFDYSGGVPRKINVSADRSLLVAFVEEKHEVSGTMAQKAIEEVRGKRPGHRAAPVSQDSEEQYQQDTDRAASEQDKTGGSPGAAFSAQERSGEPAGMKVLAFAVILGCAIIGSAFMLNQRPDTGAAPANSIAAAPIQKAPEPTSTPAESEADSNSAPVTAEEITLVQPTAFATPEASPTPQIEEPKPTFDMTEIHIEPTPTPEPPLVPWSYDRDAILRVEQPEGTYAASVLTWISIVLQQQLAPEDLEGLRQMDVEQVAALQLTAGEAPLFLRQRELPPSVDALTTDTMPALAQVDQRAAGFGPWTIVAKKGDGVLVLSDPLRGRVEVTEAEFEESLASLAMIYQEEAAP